MLASTTVQVTDRPDSPLALDNITDFAAAASSDPLERSLEWALTRYARRKKAHWHQICKRQQEQNTTGFVRCDRLTLCGKPRGQKVTLNRTDDNRTHYSGLYYCASVWACPVCSWLVRRVRSEEIQQAATQHLSQGAGLLFATFTIRHDRTMSLKDSLSTLKEAYRYVTSTRAFKDWKQEAGLIGDITATEITIGQNGWHPHMHRLLFLDKPASSQDLNRLKKDLYFMWARAVEKVGGQPVSWEAFDIQLISTGQENLASYIAKVHEPDRIGLELSLSDIKTGRATGSLTPFQLLDLDTPEAARLWHEYVAATKGRAAIRWSRGLRARLGMQKEETDQEIAEDLQAKGVPEIELLNNLYRVLARNPEALAALQGAAARREWDYCRWLLTEQCERYGLNTDSFQLLQEGETTIVETPVIQPPNQLRRELPRQPRSDEPVKNRFDCTCSCICCCYCTSCWHDGCDHCGRCDDRCHCML